MAYYDGKLLIQNLGRCVHRLCDTKMSWSEVAIKIGEAIKDTPAADVVEVVRCKECANGYCKNNISVMCKIWNRLMLTEDYCSYGGKAE